MIELSRHHFEVLRNDDEFILYRGQRGEGGSRVLVLVPTVEYPRPEGLKRLEHEYSFRKELDLAWAARPIELARHWDRTVLVLEDPGGRPLDQLLGHPSAHRRAAFASSGAPSALGQEVIPVYSRGEASPSREPRSSDPEHLDLAFCLRVAVNLANTIGHLHRRGIIHKDIKPANVLVNPATGQCWLMGFGIASRLPRERQSPGPPEFIAGTLAYMAPEQTGRMNRSIDSPE